MEQHGVLRPSLTTDMDPISQQLVMGAAGSGGSEKLYVEDVFSTWLYTGNGSTQTITNGIDLSGKGGLVWIKSRSSAAAFYDHVFCDTVRGNTKYLASSGSLATSGQTTGNGGTNDIASFNSNGFSLGTDTAFYKNTGASTTYASWTFRKAAKFFDVVTYTGNGTNRTIAHSLGSVPGCIIVKRTDTTGDWQVYHRSLANTEYLVLNTTAAKATSATRWNSTTPTRTAFSLGTDASVNASGGTYVAYLFAHDAGGFGASGNDSVVSCGSYVGNGSTNGPSINLGWEPQWLLIKNASAINSWYIYDSARTDEYLNPNLSTAGAVFSSFSYTPSGFKIINTFGDFNTSGGTYIYIAIRRGPMKTPTDATKVFNAVARTGNDVNTTVTCGFQADAFLLKMRNLAGVNNILIPRLAGPMSLETTAGAAEYDYGTSTYPANPWDVMDGFKLSTVYFVNSSSYQYINYFFKRAPGFFDIACYTGTGSVANISHNLNAVPELIFVKRRNATSDWAVYNASIGNTKQLYLNGNTASFNSSTAWNNTSPTSSVFTVGTLASVNAAASPYIAYLFASCPGVSKVGSYTGTAATLNINCGFTNGARFVLIKRTDTFGDWWYWDTSRGIISANDPYLLLNLTDAEGLNTDYIDPLSSGFQISSTAPAAINASGGSYLYLAIA